MRILWINDKTYGGGAAKLLPAATKVLLKHGHMIVPFVGKFNEGEVPVEWLPYQPPKVKAHSAWAIARRAFPYSQITAQLERMIEKMHPDIAVVQNVHQYLSFDVFRTLKRLDVPSVFLINDHALYCVNKYGYRNGGPCHDCVDKRFYRGVIKKCSLKSGLLGWIESGIRATALHYYWAKRFLSNVGAIYTNGSELKRVLVKLGADPRCIVQGIFPVDIETLPSEKLSLSPIDPYIIFYGSALPVKGVNTLLDALNYISEPINLKMFLLSSSAAIESQIASESNRWPHRIKIDIISRWDSGVSEAVRQARAVIIPSAWHSPHELVLYESMAMGKAVIVSSETGNADIVTCGRDALVFEMNNAEDLSKKILSVWNDLAFAENLGKTAHKTYQEVLVKDHWYEPFMRAVALAQEATHRNQVYHI